MIPENNTKKSSIGGLFVLGLLLSSGIVIIASAAPPPLPNPPDPADPANTVNGPLTGKVNGPYTGGVLVKPEAPADVAVPVMPPEFVAEFTCTAGTKTVTKTLPISVGMSLSGPLSNAQTSGIIDAFNDVKPKDKTVTLSATVSGDPAFIITYTLTGITYTRTIYDVYVITQAVPAMERLAGYIVVDKPKSLTIENTKVPCPTPPSPPLVIIGDGFKLVDQGKSAIDSFFDIFINILPDDGIAPFFDYGKVYIYSGGQIYGGTDVRPGETVSFEVPPGAYTVSADVGVFGFHFSVPGQSIPAPTDPNVVAMVINVTLSVEVIIYIIIIVIVIVILLILYFILRRIFGWGRGDSTPGDTDTPQQPSEPGGTTPKAEEPEQDFDRDERS